MGPANRREPLDDDLLRHVHHGERERQCAQSGAVRPRQAVQVRAESRSSLFEVFFECGSAGSVHGTRQRPIAKTPFDDWRRSVANERRVEGEISKIRMNFRKKKPTVHFEV